MTTALGLPTASDYPKSLNEHRTNGHNRSLRRPLETVENRTVDTDAIQRAVRTILEAVGEDPDRPGLQDTPRRVAKMYAEMFAGLQQDPARHLRVTFPEDYGEETLQGQEVEFTARLLELRERRLPDADDGFAGMVGCAAVNLELENRRIFGSRG